MHLRATKKNRSEVSLYDPIGTDKEGNEIALIDVLGSDQDVAEIVENSYERQRVMQKVNVLTPREKKSWQCVSGYSRACGVPRGI